MSTEDSEIVTVSFDAVLLPELKRWAADHHLSIATIPGRDMLIMVLEPGHPLYPAAADRQRSVMAELLSEQEARMLEVSEGRWHLPGTPP